MEEDLTIDRDVLQQAVDRWGQDLQELIAIEEMAELTKALIKRQRKQLHERTETEVIEEIADVYVMLEQLRLVYDSGYINVMIMDKIARLKSRLNTSTKEGK